MLNPLMLLTGLLEPAWMREERGERRGERGGEGREGREKGGRGERLVVVASDVYEQ